MSKTLLLACMTCMPPLLLTACALNGNAPQTGTSASSTRFTRPVESVLDGTWEGRLARRPPFSPSERNAKPDISDLPIRLVIQDETVQVFLEDSGDWIEAMPGKFILKRDVTNASLTGANSNLEGSGGWIENWAFLVTAIDDDSLQAEWSRVVNNLEPGTEGLPTFSMAATGVLRRVPK